MTFCCLAAGGMGSRSTVAQVFSQRVEDAKVPTQHAFTHARAAGTHSAGSLPRA